VAGNADHLARPALASMNACAASGAVADPDTQCHTATTILLCALLLRRSAGGSSHVKKDMMKYAQTRSQALAPPSGGLTSPILARCWRTDNGAARAIIVPKW
jgi:hypothetical protein